jgi:BirA family biotin operon repressor/biotin-[acetyl-CoA-carboxylase] ligase
MLTQERIETTLATEFLGRQLVYLPITGSTNTVAKELAAEGAPDGTVVVAGEQSAGRGRLGRRWLAPSGTCILCSILFRPEIPLGRAAHLTMLCSLAAADAIGQSATLWPTLKWPNDLIISDDGPGWRKLAGLLADTGITGDRMEFVVVGIGINVNVPPDALPALAPDATSILAEVGRPVDLVALLAVLLSEVEQRYRRLRAGETPYREWASRLATIGREVEATTAAGMVRGVAEFVDESGTLFLRTSSGVLHQLQVGDVTLANPHTR